MREIQHRFHCGLGAQDRRANAHRDLAVEDYDILLHYHDNQRRCTSTSTGSMLCEIIGLEFHDEPEFYKYPQTVIQVCELINDQDCTAEAKR